MQNQQKREKPSNNNAVIHYHMFALFFLRKRESEAKTTNTKMCTCLDSHFRDKKTQERVLMAYLIQNNEFERPYFLSIKDLTLSIHPMSSTLSLFFMY